MKYVVEVMNHCQIYEFDKKKDAVKFKKEMNEKFPQFDLQIRKFLESECVICRKQVEGKMWSINGAVLGDYIELKGHRKCLTMVDNLVVIPNRIRLAQVMRK